MSVLYATARRKCGRCFENVLNNDKGWTRHRVYQMTCPKCSQELQAKRAAKQPT